MQYPWQGWGNGWLEEPSGKFLIFKQNQTKNSLYAKIQMIILINDHKLSHTKQLRARLAEGTPRWQVQVTYQARQRNCPHPLGRIGEKCQNEKERVGVDRYPVTIRGRVNLPKIEHVINFLESTMGSCWQLGESPEPQATSYPMPVLGEGPYKQIEASKRQLLQMLDER